MLAVITDFFKGKPIAKRSSKWRAFRKRYIENHPACALCGSYVAVEVHHIQPFNIAPELELDETNCISLCEYKKFGVNCHLLFGHHGNYRKINKDVLADVASWRLKLAKPTTL
jgi:5-methylcytosine-specific restriction endonuclease McrA